MKFKLSVKVPKEIDINVLPPEFKEIYTKGFEMMKALFKARPEIDRIEDVDDTTFIVHSSQDISEMVDKLADGAKQHLNITKIED